MSKSFLKTVLKTLKQWGFLGYSKKHNLYGVNPFLISVIYIGLTLSLASQLRRLTKRILVNDSILRHILLEFIATLELCAACFELIIVADNWGITAYAIALFILTIWWSQKWETESACPYCPLEEVINGTKTLKTTLCIICAQLLGAILTYRYIQILWSLELVETHKGKAFEECTADLQVNMILGAFIECFLTCLCRLVSKILSERQSKFSLIMDAFFSTAMVVLAFNFSGGYFNPVLATSLKFGCSGNTFLEHFVVYWLGAFIGSILSIFLFRFNIIQSLCKKPKID